MSLSSVLSLTLLYIVIARSISDTAIPAQDSFASLGMTTVILLMGTVRWLTQRA